MLNLLNYLANRRLHSSLPGFVASVALLRTFSCGGWIYITSGDHGLMHDILMISLVDLPPFLLTNVKTTATSSSPSLIMQVPLSSLLPPQKVPVSLSRASFSVLQSHSSTFISNTKYIKYQEVRLLRLP